MEKQTGFMENALGETRRSSDVATESSRIAKETLIVTQRARLKIDRPQRNSLRDDGLFLPIRNYGQVACKGIAGRLRYIRFGVNDQSNLLESIDVTIDYAEPIRPQESFSLIVTLPKLCAENLSALKALTQIATITGRLQYDTGFNTKDELWVGLSYENGTWVDNIPKGFGVDFSASHEQDQRHQ